MIAVGGRIVLTDTACGPRLPGDGHLFVAVGIGETERDAREGFYEEIVRLVAPVLRGIPAPELAEPPMQAARLFYVDHPRTLTTADPEIKQASWAWRPLVDVDAIEAAAARRRHAVARRIVAEARRAGALEYRVIVRQSEPLPSSGPLDPSRRIPSTDDAVVVIANTQLALTNGVEW